VGLISGGGGGAGLTIPFDVSGGNSELSLDAFATLTLAALGTSHADLELTEARSSAFVSMTTNNGATVASDSGKFQAENIAGDSGALVGPQYGLLVWRNTAPDDGDLFAGACALWYDPTNGASKLMLKAKQADGTVKTAAIALA
jgi:hypothetical protein